MQLLEGKSMRQVLVIALLANVVDAQPRETPGDPCPPNHYPDPENGTCVICRAATECLECSEDPTRCSSCPLYLRLFPDGTCSDVRPPLEGTWDDIEKNVYPDAEDGPEFELDIETTSCTSSADCGNLMFCNISLGLCMRPVERPDEPFEDKLSELADIGALDETRDAWHASSLQV